MKEEVKEQFEVIRSEDRIIIKHSTEFSSMKLEVTKKNFQFDILNSMTDEELKEKVKICEKH